MLKSREKLDLKRGFSLVEAAIVLTIVGLVIGGIWVAASAINQKMTVNHLTQGALTYFHAASSLVLSNRNGGTLAMNNALAAQIMPKDLVIDAATNNYGYGGISVGWTSSAFSASEYDGVGLAFIFPLTSSGKAICKETLVRLTALAWQKIVYIYALNGVSIVYPFGGTASTPTLLSAPIFISDSRLTTICNYNSAGLNASMVQVTYGVYR